MGSIKEINIKNSTYYPFDDLIRIKDFNPNLLKIDEDSCKFVDVYYIGYITVKDSDYWINGVNPLYIIIGETDAQIEKKWK